MIAPTVADARETVDAVYRAESRRVFATLVRLLGDFDLAEEALHDAFASAVEQWPKEGVPANPRAWLVSAGRFRAIDGMRRRAKFDASLGELAERLGTETPDAAAALDDERIEDDRRRQLDERVAHVQGVQARSNSERSKQQQLKGERQADLQHRQ